MKRFISTFLAFSLLCALAGCQRNALPQPDFPLTENTITDALEKTGLPGVISESETYSSVEGHIAYTLRDPTETYEDTENKVLIAGISSAITEGERFLGMIFLSAPDKPVSLPFAWEDWKQQIVFTTLLFGSFEDTEQVYRAFSNKRVPDDEEKFKWDVQLPGGYCTVSYSFNSNLRSSYTVFINIYESKSLYEKQYEEMMKWKEELEQIPAETPN